MRILFIIDELSVRGGTELFLFRLAKGLCERGHNIVIVSLQDGDFAEEFKILHNLTYICLHVKRIYNYQGIQAIRYLVQFVKHNKIQLIQSIHTGSDLIVPIVKFLSKCDIKIISNRRDLGFTKKKHHVFLQKILNRYVDHMIGNSLAVCKSIHQKESYPLDLIEVIYNGIPVDTIIETDHSIYRKSLISKYQRSSDTLLITCVANLNVVKGHSYLIHAIKQLVELKTDFILLLAGDGPEKKSLQEMVLHHGLTDSVRFLGNVKDVISLLQVTDIYVQPSLSEGFSNSLLEAMLAGCPIVTTRVGGNPEIIEDGINGILVEPKDAGSLSLALGSLCKDKPLRLQLSDNARKKIIETFNIEIMLKNYEKLFYSIIEVQ